MKILTNKETKEHLIRYLLISLVGYAYVFINLYILIDHFKINKSIAFLITYSVWYLFLYFIQLKLLFKSSHKRIKLIKFCFFLGVFYLFSNFTYNLGLYLELNYMVATTLTILILMPLRFIISKYYVFK